jgi:hypothetical protein
MHDPLMHVALGMVIIVCACYLLPIILSLLVLILWSPFQLWAWFKEFKEFKRGS